MELGTYLTLDEAIEKARFTNGCNGSLQTDSRETRVPSQWYNFIWMPHRYGGDGYGGQKGDNVNYGTMLLFPMAMIKGDPAKFYRVLYNFNNIDGVYSYG